VQPHAQTQAPPAPANLLDHAIAALQSGDLSRAAALASEKTKRDPEDAAAWEVLGVACLQRGVLEPAIDAAQRAARLTPQVASRHANLGSILRAAGQAEAAEAAYVAAIAADPTFAPAHHNLGNLRLDQGRLHDAEASLRAAVELQADNAEAWRSLGMVLQRSGRLEEAVSANEALLALAPDHVAGLNDTGAYLMALGRLDEARARLERAVALQPDLLSAHANLGVLHRGAGRPIAALKAIVSVLELDASDHRSICNLALVLKDLGLFREAELLFRRALSLRSDYAAGHSNLLLCLNAHPDKTPRAVFEEHRRWDEVHAKALPPAAMQFDNDPNPERPLRVGLVSPDLGERAGGPFIEPMMRGLFRERIEVFCYSELAHTDAAVSRFKIMVDGWRSMAGLSDEAVAQIIRDDRIDILIDLGGHTAGGRLPVFARKPAPIQIEHFLARGGTSGLSVMDAFLCDAVMVPKAAEALFSETALRTPRIPLAYAPPPGMPEPQPGPALRRGHVTFGYFGPSDRINSKVAACWAAILKKVAGSRLMLDVDIFGERACRTLFERRFAAHGVGPERLELAWTDPQAGAWDAYAQIDIMLDPFPHSAGVSLVEALWMGAPVLSIEGQSSVGRVGASILSALNLSDWVAEDVGDYMAKAVAAAADPASLNDLRLSLRKRCEASPLADVEDHGRQLGRVLRGLWRAWSEQAPR
jgi:protein O-GlcNAc transferase